MRVLASAATQLDLWSATVDGMEHEVILLDEAGRIVLVNEAFLRFGRENGLRDPGSWVGAPYIELCFQSAADGDEEAANIGTALLQVLAKHRSSFTTVYPCHSPLEPRWFRMTATRWSKDDQAGLVLIHEDITFERLAEDAWRRAQGRWKPIDEPHRPFSVQRALDALAQRITEETGRRITVDGMEGAVTMVPPVRWMEAIARMFNTVGADRASRIVGTLSGKNLMIEFRDCIEPDMEWFEAMGVYVEIHPVRELTTALMRLPVEVPKGKE